MAARYRTVLIDTCFLACLHACDPRCELLGLVIDYYGERGVGDGRQLRLCTYCRDAIADHLGDHGISDEAMASWLDKQSSDKARRLIQLKDDPADLKLLVYALKHGQAILLTCDQGLLQCCHLYDVPHRCFKAALVEVDLELDGALLTEYTAVAQALNRSPPSHPFVQLGHDRHCPKCDPGRACGVRRDVSV